MSRVAVIRDGSVQTIICAPADMSESDYAEWSLGLLRGPFDRCALRVLRDDESCNVGDREVGASFVAPPTPLAEQISVIDAETAGRIAGGFAFKGERMSLSVQSQITISNAYTIRESLPYPLQWGNADDTGFVTMESAKDVEALYQAATMAVLLARTAGNARKKVAMEAAK